MPTQLINRTDPIKSFHFIDDIDEFIDAQSRVKMK